MMDVEDPFGPVMRHVGGCGRVHAVGTECPTDEPTADERRELEVECTSYGDLARGVRTFIGPDGATREEPVTT